LLQKRINHLGERVPRIPNILLSSVSRSDFPTKLPRPHSVVVPGEILTAEHTHYPEHLESVKRLLKVALPTVLDDAQLNSIASSAIQHYGENQFADSRVTYQVTLKVGDVKDVGTKAFVVLYGENGHNGGHSLAPGSVKPGNNVFEVSAPGQELQKVRVGLEDAGPVSGWFLEQVSVKNQLSGMEWVFPCNRWLALGEDDGHIVRELVPSRVGAESGFANVMPMLEIHRVVCLANCEVALAHPANLSDFQREYYQMAVHYLSGHTV